MKNKFLNILVKFLKKGKVTIWKASDKELTEAVRPFEKKYPGSYEETLGEGESHTGVKITFPLPIKKG